MAIFSVPIAELQIKFSSREFRLIGLKLWEFSVISASFSLPTFDLKAIFTHCKQLGIFFLVYISRVKMPLMAFLLIMNNVNNQSDETENNGFTTLLRILAGDWTSVESLCRIQDNGRWPQKWPLLVGLHVWTLCHRSNSNSLI